MTLLDVLDDRVEACLGGLVDVVVLVVPGDCDVRGDLDDREVVDLRELLLLRLRRAGHAGELLVEAEVVLERDRREGDVLLADGDALLRLDCLVEPLRPAPAFHDASGELVDDLDLAVLDDVVDVALVERLGLHRLVEVVDELRVPRVVEVLDPERALDSVDSRLARRDGLELLVELVVGVVFGTLLPLGDELGGNTDEPLRDPREVVVRPCRRLRLAGDDQRRARLVDEDRVHLVDDPVGMARLHRPLERRRHVVAQVVEAELGVRAVRDVGGVRLLALGERHLVADERRPHSERLVDRAHPLGVALRQVVVHRDEVRAARRKGVQVERHRGDEGLALTGLHLGDIALVEHDRTHHLDVEVAHPEAALGRLAHGGEGLEGQLIERFAVLEPLPELDGLGRKLLVGERLEVRLEGGDVVGLPGQTLEPPAFADAQDLLEGAVILGHRFRVARGGRP